MQRHTGEHRICCFDLHTLSVKVTIELYQQQDHRHKPNCRCSDHHDDFVKIPFHRWIKRRKGHHRRHDQAW